jgi:hypothetical protein
MKITKAQLRELIREELLNEYAGAGNKMAIVKTLKSSIETFKKYSMILHLKNDKLAKAFNYEVGTLTYVLKSIKTWDIK